MADIHSVIRNLKSKNNSDGMIEEYRRILHNEAYRFALTVFSFEYLSLTEMIYGEDTEEQDNAIPEAFRNVYESLKMAVRQYYDGCTDLRYQDILALRDENRNAMELYTGGIDLFTINEYVLNRIEHRFMNGTELAADYSDLKMTENIMHYLAGLKDEEQNLSIVSIIEQLPVRMTKNRFAETVHDRLGIYRESDGKAFSDICETVRSAAGLKPLNITDAALNGIVSLDEKVQTLDPDSVTEDDFLSHRDLLEFFGTKINDGIDFGTQLQDTLNSFAVLLIARDAETFEEEHVCRDIVSDMLQIVEKPEKAGELLDLSYEKCELLEGIQEDSIQELQNALGYLNTFDRMYPADLSDMRLISILISNSSFAETAEDVSSDAPMESAEFERCLDRLTGELISKLKSVGKNYSRALMAHVFSVLPPHFSTQEELENYIFESLSGCTNTAEKLGLLDILNVLMEE